VLRARTEQERDALWRVRRETSYALRTIAPLKLNNDVVVPHGRVPELIDLVERLRAEYRLRIPSFGHAGDGNIHVNVMVDPADAEAMARATKAVGALMEGVVALQGSISGEHGIGFAKKAYIGLELSEDVIALMKRVKSAFDPHGILNPGKIFP
jgi:FAD/FMN-containing dehydrogenase